LRIIGRNAREDVINGPCAVGFNPPSILGNGAKATGRAAFVFPNAARFFRTGGPAFILEFVQPKIPLSAGRQVFGFRPLALIFSTILNGVLFAGSAFNSAFSFFGFRISRLLRFCPLAMAERPFDESCLATRLRQGGSLEVVLCGYPFMTFVVVTDTILRRAATRWKLAGDMIDFDGQRRSSEKIQQPYGLPNIEFMRCNVAPYWLGLTL
jgi:hypothetical protein